MKNNEEEVVKIQSTSEATRTMTVAFKLSMSAPGKSDRRRAEIRTKAKALISAAENYVEQETSKFPSAEKEKKELLFACQVVTYTPWDLFFIFPCCFNL